MRKAFILLYLAAFVTSCGSPEPIRSTANLTLIENSSELPPPNRADLIAADRPALIGPLDTIEIDVLGIPELRREMQVDASGRIAMPLAGTIDARGKTSEELANTVETALRAEYVRDPQVTVNIRSSVSQVVTIDGQVTEPGLYPVTNEMTLMRVVASARGLTEYAKQDDVVILRTVENQRMAGLYNITAIRRGVYEDPPVYANDIIVVGDSPQRRLFRDVISTAPLIVAPLVAILR